MEVFREIQTRNISKSTFSSNSFEQVLPVTHSANKGSIKDLDTSMKHILDQIESIKQEVEKDKFDCFIEKTMLIKSDKENSILNFSKKGTVRDIKFSKDAIFRLKKKIETYIHLEFDENKKSQSKQKDKIKTFTFLNPISYSKIDKLPCKKITAQIQLEDSNSDYSQLTRGRACSFFHPLLATPLKIENFSLGQLIGSGKFGDVHLCQHKQTKWLFALKKILKSTIIQYKMMTQFINQLKIQYKLDHPNIVKLYSHFSDEYHIFLIMEYIPGGNLFQKIKSSQSYVSNVLQQSLQAIDYIHKNSIIHRDIKPENIVKCFDNTFKLCDFGLSTYMSPLHDVKTSFCGTLDYIAPEMKDFGAYDYSIDIWGLGVLTYELLVGQAPFKDEITNWKKRGGKRNNNWNWTIRYPQAVSDRAIIFMKNLLKADPHQRISIQAALSSNFIKGNNKIKCEILQKQVRTLGLRPL